MADCVIKRIWLFLCIITFLCSAASIADSTEIKKTTIRDMAGRTVKLPENPSRIVAVGPGALRFIVYMDAFDKVVGIEEIEKSAQMPAGRPYSIAIYDRAKRLPTLGEGGSGRLPDFEKIISLKPDVIFVLGTDSSNTELIQSKTAVPVVSLSIGVGVFKKDETFASLRLIGKILGKQKRAEDLINFINKAEKDLKDRTNGILESNRPSVYVGAVSYKGTHGITSTEGFYMPLEWANGKNVVNELKKPGHIFIDREKLLLWNPDVLFIDAAGLNLVNADYQKNPVFYKKLKAVKENKAFTTMPYNHYNTNIEVVIANSYFIGKSLYPERFKDIDPLKKADEIFRYFVGIPVYRLMEKEFKGFKSVVFGEGMIDVR